MPCLFRLFLNTGSWEMFSSFGSFSFPFRSFFFGFGFVFFRVSVVSQVVLTTSGSVKGGLESKYLVGGQSIADSHTTVIIMLCNFPSLSSQRKLLLWEGKEAETIRWQKNQKPFGGPRISQFLVIFLQLECTAYYHSVDGQ